MALQECGLNLNRVSKELQPHGSPDFPCAGYLSSHRDRPEDVIPWHWHEEMEMVYVESGKMKIKIPSKSFFWKKETVSSSIQIFFTTVLQPRNAGCAFLSSVPC